MFNKFLLGLDLWNEILSYFEVSLEDNDEKVVKEKRKAMFAIALLSPKLTELALDALWKNMTTLVPMVSAANSGGKFLEHHVSNGRGCWRIFHRWDLSANFLDDLIRNLNRVRSLRVKVSEKELELWQMLYALLAPRSMAHLLPRLQTLSLVSADDPQSHPFLAVISYIFAPSLTSISVRGNWGASWDTVEHFIASHDLPNLSQLLYFNADLSVSLSDIGRLTGLRHLILHQFHVFSALDDLVSLCCLQKLSISISISREDTKYPSTTPITFPALQDLQLASDTEETFDLFFRQVQLPSLISLSLGIYHVLREELPLELIVAAYPNLLHLAFHCINTQGHSYKMTANDFMSIVNVRGLKSLKLVNIPHKLKGKDIFSLVKSLPVLHSLAIMGLGIVFSAKLLISISQLSNLRYIELPLDFSHLVDYVSSKQMSESPSELRKIISTRSLGIPPKSSAKVILIRNILHLFPKLEELGGTGASMEDLRGLFEVVNNMFYKPS